MSLLDRMMDRNFERAKKMQKKMLDMQEELYNENGEQIERVNKRSAELGAEGTRIHYKAAASGVKEGLGCEAKKSCCECGKKIDAGSKFCNECGTKQ
jgi:hypothetical protein